MTSTDQSHTGRKTPGIFSSLSRAVLCGALALQASAIGACDRELVAKGKGRDKITDEQQATAVEPYPGGRWRLARELLPEVLLSVSHILVLHDTSDPLSQDVADLRPGDWSPDKIVHRTKGQARELAHRLTRQAQASPNQFADLARTHSDDVVTASQGGSLGFKRANELPPAFLDAIASMHPGDVSRVVETRLGFHILKWNLPPKEQTLSASHITIAYQTTSPYGLRPGRTADRTRDEALILAKRVAAEARRDPSRFTHLVDQFSDDADAAIQGDFGQWSTYDPNADGRALEIISRLKANEVSEPLDSVWGFEIFKREENTDRPRHAVREIRVFYDRFDAGADAARERAKKMAQGLLQQVNADPERFSDLQEQHCCSGIQHWSAGTQPVGLNAAIEKLKMGETSKEVVETLNAFHILRRLDPAEHPLPKHRPSFALPSPEHPNLEHLIESGVGPALAHTVSGLKARVAEALPLPPKRAKRLAEILDKAGERFQSEDPSQFVAIYRETNREIEQALGPKAFGSYMQQLQTLTEELLMHD